jgi:hypothetical protein
MKGLKPLIIGVVFMAFAISGAAAEKIEKGKILTDNEEWQEIYEEFTVDESMVEAAAAKIGDNLTIDVYLGLWCGDSKNNVPPFLKIIEKIDEISDQKMTVHYYTVERKPSKKIKYFVEELKVERVPTFIFYRDGKEIGRIIENPKNSLIEDFLEIIF